MAIVKSRRARVGGGSPNPTRYHNNDADETSIPRCWTWSVTVSYAAKTIQVTGDQIKTTGDEIRLTGLHPLILFGSTVFFLCQVRHWALGS